VNSWFHLVTFYRRHTGRIFKQGMIKHLTQRRKDAKEILTTLRYLCVFAPLRETFFVFLSQKTPSTYP
jgi:hypothetical protein